VQNHIGPGAYNPSVLLATQRFNMCKVQRTHTELWSFLFMIAPVLDWPLVGGHKVAEMRIYTDQKARSILGSRSLLPRLPV
jgi:hypothetical protein